MATKEGVQSPTRRVLLTNTLKLGGLMAAATSTAAAAWEGGIILGATPQKETSHTHKSGVFPGWIEKPLESPFIQPNKGHFYWMREAIFSNSILFDLTAENFAYFNQALKEEKRLKLGDTLKHSINRAAQRLSELDPSTIDPRTNFSLEAVHAGLFSFTAVFTPWFSPDELRKLGVPIDNYKSVANYYWDRDGVATSVFPKLFGVDRPDLDEQLIKNGHAPRFGGQDRATHFANHLFIAFMYQYLKENQVPDYQTMPNILRWGARIAGRGSTPNEAKAFSEIIGRIYELTYLKHPESWPLPFKSRESIEDGPHDIMAEADYKGNRLGAETAIRLWRRAFKNESLEPIFEELNDDKFSLLETEPKLAA